MNKSGNMKIPPHSVAPEQANLKALTKPRPEDFCLLCSAEPSVIGVFVPENAQEYGAVKGKTRFIRYCLCTRCHSKQGTLERVEKVIWAELSGGAISC
jgi:hypothetical protein